MALPERFERVGIVVGSIIVLSLPASALFSAFYPPTVDVGPLIVALRTVVWVGPGLVVGVLVAFDRLPISYRQVWLFAICAVVFTLGLWAVLGLAEPWNRRVLALGAWILATGLAAFVTSGWERYRAHTRS